MQNVSYFNNISGLKMDAGVDSSQISKKYHQFSMCNNCSALCDSCPAVRQKHASAKPLKHITQYHDEILTSTPASNIIIEADM
jgi:succinate dehydrogenase/fumarate reductase-like Fe-S protein